MKSSMQATLELVRQSQAGDREALDALFARYAPRVLKIVRLRMHAALRVRLDSVDVLQDTILAAFKGFDAFEMRDEASFINWLSRIAENTIADSVDRLHTQKRDPGREVAVDASELSAGPLVPLDVLVRGEEEARLAAAIASLPDEYRECIVLRNYVGASFAAIAEQSERPSEGAARMMHAQAMRRLVAALAD